MSEWKPFNTAPKDGTAILATGGTGLYTIEWIPEGECWTVFGGNYTRVIFTHWMETPELPVKDHECFNGKMKYVRCYNDHGKLYLEMSDECKTYSVNYCPFCGEKA